jgi:hypothetical protein
MKLPSVCIALLGAVEAANVAPSLRKPVALVASHEDPPEIKCPPLGKYPNAKTKDYGDSRATKYEDGEHVPVEFAPGDVIAFECVKGFTIDGSKGGDTAFDVECSEQGYFKPGGVCLEASKCGAAPEIANALPSGKVFEGPKKNNLEMMCANGYSLDGENVVPGGLGKNSHFELECISFSGDYKKFEGECKPFNHMPAKEAGRVYNRVFKALFVVSCKNTLKTQFSKGKEPSVDTACGKITDSALAGECDGLVTKIKADFETKKTEREAFDKDTKKEWFEEKDPDRPGIKAEAKDFCTNLWGLLEYNPPAELLSKQTTLSKA